MLSVDAWCDSGKRGARLIMQAHDELVLEVETGKLAEVSAAVQQHMTAAADLRVPLRVRRGFGRELGRSRLSSPRNIPCSLSATGDGFGARRTRCASQCGPGFQEPVERSRSLIRFPGSAKRSLHEHEVRRAGAGRRVFPGRVRFAGFRPPLSNGFFTVLGGLRRSRRTRFDADLNG
jgi:hypothetical protein